MKEKILKLIETKTAIVRYELSRLKERYKGSNNDKYSIYHYESLLARYVELMSEIQSIEE